MRQTGSGKQLMSYQDASTATWRLPAERLYVRAWWLCRAVSCRSGTWCVCWSPSNEYQLFSGDGSGAVRLWDIRRSGCRALLDFNTTQRPKPTAPASSPAPNPTARKRARTGDLAGHGLSGDEEDGLVQHSRSKATGAAVAHEGAVTGLLATQDGLSLVSSGVDHKVRLWDAGTASGN